MYADKIKHNKGLKKFLIFLGLVVIYVFDLMLGRRRDRYTENSLEKVERWLLEDKDKKSIRKDLISMNNRKAPLCGAM